MPLSRHEVLAGALRVLDEVGLEPLTMRRLADELDVQAGAIYWHFANKQALVDAMADEQMAGVLEPPLTGSWDDQLAEVCRRLAKSLLARRDSARLASAAMTPGPHGMAVSEAMMRIAHGSQLPEDATLAATAALGYFVLGYVTDFQALEAAKSRGLTSALRAFKTQLDPRKYPELSLLSDGGVERLVTGKSFRERFELGLRMILEGIKSYGRKRKTGRQCPNALAQ